MLDTVINQTLMWTSDFVEDVHLDDQLWCQALAMHRWLALKEDQLLDDDNSQSFYRKLKWGVYDGFTGDKQFNLAVRLMRYVLTLAWSVFRKVEAESKRSSAFSLPYLAKTDR